MLFLLTTVASCAKPAPITQPPTLNVADAIWVERTLANMSLEERVGQMLMLRLTGGFENVRGDGMREAERMIAEVHPGGFSVGIGSPHDVAQKLNMLQERSAVPLIFAADLEWGSAMRLWRPTYLPYGIEGGGGTAFPTNMGIAATGDVLQAELAGRVTAAEARAVGIQWLFAPVTDVNSVPENPIVNVRAYGSDPATAGAFAAAFIRGATDGGVLTTAKHFPGHGDTRVDSHVGLPVVHVDSATLWNRELRPFRDAIAAGVPSVMLGHIAVPSTTNGVAVPATLSPELATKLLRTQLEFNGIVITDAMTMGALRELPGYSPGEVVVRAVEAGADVVLSPPDAVIAHRALVAAVRSGRIHYTRVDSSVARILRAKARVGLSRAHHVALDSVAYVVGAPEHEIVAADMAARSITLARDSSSLLPLDPRRVSNVAVIAFTGANDLRGGAAFADEMTRIYGRGVTFTRLDETLDDVVYDSAVARARRADATIFATFLVPISGQGNLSVPERARRVASALNATSSRMMVVSFGDPYGSALLPGASTYLLAWQPRADAPQRAAARAIAGRLPIPGKLPIDLRRATLGGLDRPAFGYGLAFAEPAEVGMNADLLARVDTIITAAIRGGAAPGAALAVGRHGRLVRLRGYGSLDWRGGYPAATDSTLWDLASLTKVIATTTALMMLIDERQLSLDDPVMQHIREWRGSPSKERVTIRNLLLHNAGLAAYGPLWRELQGRDQYRRRLGAISLDYEPGTRTVYSDFGIILLGMIIEQVSGQPLDVFLQSRLFGPLGMRDTGFNPLTWPYTSFDIIDDNPQPPTVPDPLVNRIAPTEIDTIFRKRHIRGQVHDENAFAMGGVAGHAGLFSSVRDLAIFAQMMLNRGYYGGRRYIDPATVDLFTQRADASSSRALGWDTPDGSSSAGAYFSARSFGHTGFTGTSLWIDPERQVFVILLTNRVNPTRDNQRHVPLRRDVADAVQKAITDVPVAPREDRSGRE